MELTPPQEDMLRGKRGPSLAQFMRWLVDWGGAMGARRLVKVENVHLSGLSPPAIERAPVTEEDFEAAGKDAELYCSSPVSCPCTCANADISFGSRDDQGALDSPRLRRFQDRLLKLAREAGVILNWTCTPYLTGNLPLRGEICAWTESSAIVFVNSILAARTTRHGTESAVAAAATGCVPEFGTLTDEGRRPELLIQVRTELDSPSDWGALGYFAGDHAGLRIPVFTGIRRVNMSQAKQICSAIATTGGVAMFHIEGVTPEAADLRWEETVADFDHMESHVFGSKELRSTYTRIRDHGNGPIDYVVLGCPHLSLQELVSVLMLLGSRRISSNIRFELWLPYALRAEAQRLGFLEQAESAGLHVLSDSCPAVCRARMEGVRVLTDSFKQAHYLKAAIGARVAVDDWRACVEAAVKGHWSP
jgi:predicted aconitase